VTAPRPAASGTLYLRVFLDAITACAVDVALQQVPREGAIRTLHRHPVLLLFGAARNRKR
jgi:hypothetical protein